MLHLRGVTKKFGTFTALDSFDFQVEGGEIVALLGENGAGKSTTIGLIGGQLRPDAGEIVWQDQAVRWKSPRQAARSGIGVVHQHFALVPAFTVAENLALHAPRGRPLYSKSEWENRAAEWARQLGWQLDPRRRIRDLSVGEQQRVEIIKAVFGAGETRLLLLDEPTANLTPQEAGELFDVLRRLRETGMALLFVSHKLREVMELCDRAVILRRGLLTGQRVVSETNLQELAELMVGRETITESAPKSPQSTDSPVLLRLTDAEASGLKPINLEMTAGEIVGLAGVDGNGQRELFELLAGLRPLTAGTLTYPSAEASGETPHLALVPPDRRSEGLILTFDVAENLALGERFRREFIHYGKLNWRAARQRARAVIQEFDIRSPVTNGRAGPERTLAGRLSGGNAQKVVLARALTSEPHIVVAVDPTRGLDVGATSFVHAQLRRAAEGGAAVLLISTDLDEVLALSHRIGALFAGGLLPGNDKLLPGDAERDAVGRLMGGDVIEAAK